MEENTLLAMLANLCGDITLDKNPDTEKVLQLHQAISSALISDPAAKASAPFQFEQLETFSTHHLTSGDLQQMNSVLQAARDNTQAAGERNVRVFRREVPFLSSQIKGSVPEWGRGASIINTVGPVVNRDGRRVWFDFYKIIPVVQVWMQGAAQPFLLLPLEVRKFVTTPSSSYNIPEGSVWIKSDLFSSGAPGNLYCGLTVKGGQLTFDLPLAVSSNNKLVVQTGMKATIHLNLQQKTVTETSPDNYGIDAKESAIELPAVLDFYVKSTGAKFTAIGSANWNLYDQKVGFTYDKGKPMRWSPELNRIIVPFQASVSVMNIVKCRSNFSTIKGKAPVLESSWALPAALINVSSPLKADGTGAMAMVVANGLTVHWRGLKDSNLYDNSSVKLLNALVMVMPGRINIATLFASNPTGKQRYNLWQETGSEVKKAVQYIDLLYTANFFFFYDCLQQGTESVAAQTNCVNSVDKPVKVDGKPFRVESLQTILALSGSQKYQTVMLYDDNILSDNWVKTQKPLQGVAFPPVKFSSLAIALNNALLTVSPVNGMFLYGELKSDDSFDQCLLVYSFGLLNYIPTLPDPYAANLSKMYRRNRKEGSSNLYSGSDIRSLLVCLMNWKNMDSPSVKFFMGEKPVNAPENIPAADSSGTPAKRGVKISEIYNKETQKKLQRTHLEKNLMVQKNAWQTSVGNREESSAMVDADTRSYMMMNQSVAVEEVSPFQNAFALLDVSTNADLVGVSLGFVHDELVFRKTHAVQEELPSNPIAIAGMDVYATSRLVQIFTLPQISWEPVINTTTDLTNPALDPYPGVLFFMNDGTPAQSGNRGMDRVNIAPIPLTSKLAEWYARISDFALWSYFTLPYGMQALAKYVREADGKKPVFELIEKKFAGGLNTGLQIKTEGLYDPIYRNRVFKGSAHQKDNAYNLMYPATGKRSILSGSVTEIFNREFGSVSGLDPDYIVPLERYDFTGYGANVFSHWVNENAALAQTSQAMFDVWRGRTAHEVIQVKSVLYPWGIRVVRTITIYRGSNSFEWRVDSGWKAESNGIYDFRTPIKPDPSDSPALKAAKIDETKHTYKFHPGMVEGVYNVHNIKEDNTLAPFTIKTWHKDYGVYIDNFGHPREVGASGQDLEVKLVPVYFDADVEIEDIVQGGFAVPDKPNKRVSSQRMLGYLQMSPKGVFIDQEQFANLLTMMHGLGGPVDCTLNINNSRQMMRISRVEVNPGAVDAAGNRLFIAAAKGTPVLPKDGSWSVVQHNAISKEVTPLIHNDVIPLIRQGERKFTDPKTLDYNLSPPNPVFIAEASELFNDLEDRAKQYCFLQSTGENKVLFRNPVFKKNLAKLKGSIPDLADAYRLMNSKGIFPNVENLPKLDQIGDDPSKFGLQIIDEGYKLLHNTDVAKKLKQLLPPGPWYIVKTDAVKVYVEYKPTKPDPSVVLPGDALLDFDIDSQANKWVNKMNDVTMVVDLGKMERLILIRGKFDTKKGSSPAFIEPVMEFGEKLKPVVDILVLLSEIAIDPSYANILKNGLKIAMSNSPNNWEYKFQADKEIPLVKFPPPLLDTAAAPLRLEAGLKAGVYFNVAIPLPPAGGFPVPSAGAFLEFYGKLSVMCVSVGVGTLYAVGQVTLRLSADTVTGPGLYMKFGFGVEAVVALPVVGSVSVYLAAGVEMNLDSTQITVAAFVLFKGRAEILGGIVTVTIQIEASGKVQERLGSGSGASTTMIAQVTFSLDISICFIINISFSESWEEQRQIA